MGERGWERLDEVCRAGARILLPGCDIEPVMAYCAHTLDRRPVLHEATHRHHMPGEEHVRAYARIGSHGHADPDDIPF